MRLTGGRRSDNVEDRRGVPGRAVFGGGIGMVLIVVVGMFLGVNPARLMQLLGGGAGGQRAAQQGPVDPEQEKLKDFVELVLGDTELVWNDLFRKELGENYREPNLVLFTGAVRTACGQGQAQMGPFYCPADSKVYIDLSFYEDLRERFGAPGDAAQAYVIAHEVGHHVQNLRGTSTQVHRSQQGAGEEEANQLSVRLELQADYLAGVWLHHAQKARGVLEVGDLDEVFRAAEAIGDDRLQKSARGYARPESFTHGTSAQRKKWFTRGFEQGTIRGGDETFQLPYRSL